ncbi:calcium-binding protein [Candidatus Accumulibacter sp. ACC005]|uniref:beta strand repeat-containing protein n=1 Tax=Candidatus Accumulibacter sp. ACC005 TaxID=2823331 RepID=UPI0025C48028|nr:calcium-binding protein [Candidatus Accumulibacter sp. ACC005]
MLTASGAVTSLTYQQVINTAFLSSKTATPLRVDPLILDLDNDGLETIGINTSNPILFDHNGNGVRTATGWVKSDDAFLVLDRNGNGSIDNGRELFGDSTPLTAGGVAADGFAALAQEDTNGDGKVDSLDARFASLRLWRDLNQDGASQVGELFTLSSQGIIALNLAKTANSQILANGNQIADLGGYVRSDGSTGTLGEVTAQLGDINLTNNPFYSQFTDPIPLSEQARNLPDMQGAGLVRSLREAASLPTAAGSALATQLAAYAAETTRSGQLARLDDLLKAWANTSSMATTATGAFAGVNLTVNFAGVTTGSPAWQAWLDKLSVLERFNGQTFLPVPAAGTTLTIDVFNTREALLDASYAALKASVYGGLLLQTRLKPYLDDITLTVDENGLKVDFSTMESRLDAAYQADSPNAFIDRLELIRHAGRSLEPMGWRGEQKLATWISAAEASGTWATTRAAIGAEFTTTPAAGDDIYLGTSGNDIVNGSGGNDYLLGADGNDNLKGGTGDDTLDGGSGNDTLNGGSGNANDGLGNDTYLFGRGDGNDTIYDQDVTAGNMDTIRFKDGVLPSDVTLSRPASGSEDLLLSINGTTDSLRVFAWFGSVSNRVERVEFPDGSVWDTTVLIKAPIQGTSGADYLVGRDDLADTIMGNAGNDILIGGGGNDRLEGGAGDDTLNGGSGEDTASYNDAPSGVTVSLATGAAQATGGAGTDTLIGIENLTGSSHNDSLTGNSAANRLDGGAGADTLIGGDGSDTYYVDNVGDLVIETNAVLATGGDDTVYSSLAAYTLTANVETLRLVATGAADGSGNSLNNTLYAGAGNNVLNGGAGIDTVSYSLAAAAVTVSLASSAAQATGGSGSDILVNIENLVGSAYNDRLTGDGLANRLDGGGGNDTLNGGAGADTLIGGDGSDIYYVDNVGDSVVELADQGNDIIYSSVSWALGEHVERLYLTGSATTTATGNTLANTLYGHANSAANVLAGGLGNDIYYLGAGDSAVEDDDGGTDSVYTYADYTLAANVEHLYLNVATAATLTGNALANSLRGNAGDDTLIGLTGNDTLNGDLGADTMIGGLGNDSYYVDNAADSVVEELNEGNDIIYSSVSWTLGEHVERLYLTGSDPTTAIGNALANTLYGHANSAANVLTGGLGNDVYYLGAGDSAVEDEGGGTDSVYTYADYTLAANIEHLYLNVATAATLTGNALANSLRGNAGDDTLIGLSGNDTLNGGLGNDTLTGGDGKDIIRFDSLLNALTNVDTITDYNVADDTIHLENAIFTALTTTGMLAAESFRRGAVAVDADDYVIYDDVTGALYYDADGNGVAAAVQFAALSGAPALTNADFLVT